MRKIVIKMERREMMWSIVLGNVYSVIQHQAKCKLWYTNLGKLKYYTFFKQPKT